MLSNVTVMERERDEVAVERGLDAVQYCCMDGGPTSPGHQVCIDDGTAQLPEHGGDGALPRGDAPR